MSAGGFSLRRGLIDMAVVAGALGIIYTMVFEFDYGQATMVDPVRSTLAKEIA